MEGAGFKQTWNNIPWVTRHTCAVVIVLFIIFAVQPYWAVWGWRYAGAPRWQVWRYVLAPLSYSGDTMNGVISVLRFCSMLQTLESTIFRSRSRTTYYLLWLACGFNIVGSILPDMHAYLSGMVAAMIYTLAQESPFEQALFFVFPLQRRYLPLVNIVFSYVASAGSIQATFDSVFGIIIGHSFLYFTELLPLSGGHQLFMDTPRPLLLLDKMEENERKRGAYGSGRRLGKEKWF